MKKPDANNKPPLSADPVGLRRRAEQSLNERRKQAPREPSEVESQRQRQELEVHQIELELQNAELLAARTELEAALEKYTDLYDFAPVGYLTLDAAGIIQEINLTGASLLGLARGQLVNRRFGLFVAAAELPAFDDFLQKVFARKVRQVCEVTLELPGPRPLTVEMEAIAVASGLAPWSKGDPRGDGAHRHYSTGRACRVTLADITERKRAEADRLILSKLESTGLLAGGIAHDFNNLLAVILMNLDLARMYAPSQEEFGQRVDQAIQATARARGLTEQLLTFTASGAPARKPTALTALIQEATRLALSGSRVRCEFAPPPDLWAANVDEGQIGQVIRNLVLNAREAMLGGGVVTVRAENVVLHSAAATSLPPGEYVLVTVADQGSGMTKELQTKIFDPYFSTKQRGTQKGMGLGLTICHTVLKRHGGAIAVESEVGVGSTFRLHLPASRKLVPAAAETALPTVPPRRGRILVMDDEAGLRAVIGEALQGMGHEVVLVSEGARAVEVYERSKTLGRPFDAVFLDLTVKAGSGGQETIPKLLQFDPGVRAIVMSGYASDPVLLNYERHGFKGVLAKPFDVAELREVLSRVMGSAENPITP